MSHAQRKLCYCILGPNNVNNNSYIKFLLYTEKRSEHRIYAFTCTCILLVYDYESNVYHHLKKYPFHLGVVLLVCVHVLFPWFVYLMSLDALFFLLPLWHVWYFFTISVSRCYTMSTFKSGYFHREIQRLDKSFL
jgi:hypothetical protein